MQLRDECDVAVVGGGMAGLCAALQAAARGASTVLFEAADAHGGLVFNVGSLDDYPAPGTLSGSALAESLLERFIALGGTPIRARVDAITERDRMFRIDTNPSAHYAARTVIVASGGRLRQLGIPGEREFAGRGVSQCDWCDAGFFRGEKVVVVGGGDSALQAALHLARTSSAVTVVIRGPEPRARRAYLERAADEQRIDFLWDTRLTEVIGSDRVEAVRLVSADVQVPALLACSGVFVFAGIDADARFVPASAERDENGRLRTGVDLQTTHGGIFAAGAVRSGYCGGLAAAIGEAAIAAAAASERAARLAP